MKLSRDKNLKFKNVSSSSEFSQSFFERDHSASQETSAGTSDFNHPAKVYVNYWYVSSDLSVQTMSISE